MCLIKLKCCNRNSFLFFGRSRACRGIACVLRKVVVFFCKFRVGFGADTLFIARRKIGVCDGNCCSAERLNSENARSGSAFTPLPSRNAFARLYCPGALSASAEMVYN